jgi:hypothetical protein
MRLLLTTHCIVLVAVHANGCFHRDFVHAAVRPLLAPQQNSTMQQSCKESQHVVQPHRVTSYGNGR